MYCSACGNQLRDEDRFCPQCGRSTSPGASEPAGAPHSARRLVRPMGEKSIAGVCAGFARYLGMDLALMRVIWLCVAIFTGFGFIAYLVCWIVMPKEYPEASYAAQAHRPTGTSQNAEPQES